jgi:hypothetical protein
MATFTKAMFFTLSLWGYFPPDLPNWLNNLGEQSYD